MFGTYVPKKYTFRFSIDFNICSIRTSLNWCCIYLQILGSVWRLSIMSWKIQLQYLLFSKITVQGVWANPFKINISEMLYESSISICD